MAATCDGRRTLANIVLRVLLDQYLSQIDLGIAAFKVFKDLLFRINFLITSELLRSLDVR